MATATFDPDAATTLARRVPATVVMAVDKLTLSGLSFTPLPEVQWLEIRHSEGADPGHARFRWQVGASPLDETYQAFGAQLDLSQPRGGLPAAGDRICVATIDAEDRVEFLFDGIVSTPGVQLAPNGYGLPFEARGIAITCWDQPLGGAIVRDASYAGESTPDFREAVQTELDWRVNPDGLPNCAATDVLADDDPDRAFPPFVDHKANVPDTRRVRWTLGRLTRYLLYSGEYAYAVENRPVELPGPGGIDALLESRKPKRGDTYDPKDPSTYVDQPLYVRDQKIAWRPWPDVLAAILEPRGFGFRWRLRTEDGEPRTALELYRSAEGEGSVKSVSLQEAGPIRPGASMISALRLDRDSGKLANSWRSVGRPRRVEAGFVLAPLFDIQPADRDRKKDFLLEKADLPDSPDAAKYRLWGFDEAGEARWDWKTATMLYGTPSSPAAVFPGRDGGPIVARRRPGRDELLLKDDNGKVLRAQLYLLFDYLDPAVTGVVPSPDDPDSNPTPIPDDDDIRTGEPGGAVDDDPDPDPDPDPGPDPTPDPVIPASRTVPGIWDGAGTIVPIKGGWRLDRDSLSVRITVNNPNEWPIGHHEDRSRVRAGHVPAITWLQHAIDNPDDHSKRFDLLLVCVVDDDYPAMGVATRRSASPIARPIVRYVDHSDQRRLELVHKSSTSWEQAKGQDPALKNHASGPDWLVARDETDTLDAEATARRAAHESPPVAGTITLPYLSRAFEVGDRIREISGRGINLSGSVSKDGKTPVYPRVVARTWTHDGESGIETTLALNDRRGDLDAPPEPEEGA
jgi:hypothetical protein